MNALTLARLGAKHARNGVAESLYQATGRNFTRPIVFYGVVNERCQLKCRYCGCWRLPHYRDEMAIEEWQRALLSIKRFVGEFFINLSGGEPFLKQDFLDLLAFASRNGIRVGVTTNGLRLKTPHVERIVATRPFSISISIDSPDEEVNDCLRGRPGLLRTLTEGITLLRRESHRQGLNLPIIIKPTVSRANFRQLPRLVEWVVASGATALNLQPMNRWTPETHGDLWIEADDLGEFEAVVRRLVEMRRAGAPIMNSDEVLLYMVHHFRGGEAPRRWGACRVALRNFSINCDGEVTVCFGFPAIGNIRRQSAREIWGGPAAEEVRRKVAECRTLCLATCTSPKTLRDRVVSGLQLLRGPSSHGAGPPSRGRPAAAGRAPSPADAEGVPGKVH